MNQAKQAVNPYLPSYEYVPDGEPHVFNGRVYVYGSHDRFGGNDFCLNDYVCWSARADDLANWRYEGTSYRSVQDPLCAEGSTAMRLFAPDVQRGGDGRYYLFYALEFCGRISVAVSESPVGPFQFYDHVHYPDGTLLGAKEGDAFQYDPGIFVDDNGRVYLVSPIPGINPKFATMHLVTKGCQLIELADDMCTVREAPQIVLPQQADAEGTEFAEHPFFEAPSLRKANGRYYLIYSSTQNHELCYAVADKPQGVYHYGGTIVSNGDIGLDGRTVPCNYTGTNHGSIVEINGQWYVFYHRQTNRTPYSRQGCAEKITLLQDGSIPQVRVTSCGLNDGPLKIGYSYPAGIACCLQTANGAGPYRAKTTIGEEHPYITQDGPDGDIFAQQYVANLRWLQRGLPQLFAASRYRSYSYLSLHWRWYAGNCRKGKWCLGPCIPGNCQQYLADCDGHFAAGWRTGIVVHLPRHRRTGPARFQIVKYAEFGKSEVYLLAK